MPGAGGDRQLQTWLSKERENETQPPPHGPGSSMSSAPAAGYELGIDLSRRLPAELVTHCPLALMPAVKALRAIAAASRSGRT